MSVSSILTSNTTVSFTSGMTAAQINALILEQPRNLNNYTLTFQFGDGTYNTSMTSALNFTNFYGGGQLNIYGNITETNAQSLHTTQAVFLDFSAGTSGGIVLSEIHSLTLFSNLKIKISNSQLAFALAAYNMNDCVIQYNYFLGAAKTNDCRGNQLEYGNYSAVNNYYENTYMGISANVAKIYSNTNASVNTAPNYGLVSNGGSDIGKNSTQPTGTTANEASGTGGVIR